MIDIHSHILPQMDDGSSSVEESISLIEQLQQQGVDTLCATPHFYAQREDPASFIKRRQESFGKIAGYVQKNHIDFHVGAEVRYFLNISRMDPALTEGLLISGTRLLLLEMPFTKWTDTMIEEVLDLNTHYQVVLAHIERYFHWNPLRSSVWQELEEEGVLFQVNAEDLCSWKPGHALLKMMHQHRICFVASDTHNLTTRPPRFDQASLILHKKLQTEDLDYLEQAARHAFYAMSDTTLTNGTSVSLVLEE